jgi:hypothetical protein
MANIRRTVSSTICRGTAHQQCFPVFPRNILWNLSDSYGNSALDIWRGQARFDSDRRPRHSRLSLTAGGFAMFFKLRRNVAVSLILRLVTFTCVACLAMLAVAGGEINPVYAVPCGLGLMALFSGTGSGR